jgi:adenylate cyclase class 2
MDIEFEATFPNIDKSVIRQSLKNAGAVLVRPEFMQTRVIINPPDFVKNKNAWIRLRNEGDKVTLTYKVIAGNKIEDQKEICLQVDDFAKTLEFLQKIGCEVKSWQESTRELWRLAGVEICLDEWPYLPPFVEIEGQSELAVKVTAEKIGFDYSQAQFGNVGNLYQKKYGIEPHLIHEQIARLTFADPNPFITYE